MALFRKRVRRFGGQLFHLHEWYITRPDADIAAAGIRRRGSLARVVRCGSGWLVYKR